MSIGADRIIAVRTRKTIYKEDDKVKKVFDEDFSKADVLNEALNQARVEETGLNIPALIEVKKYGQKWAITSKYIEGTTLEKLMELNKDKEDEYLEKFVDIQMYMHKKTAPLLNKLRDKLNRKINESDLDAVTRYDLQTRLESLPRHAKLCHGDFNPSNIIINDKGEFFILDWSHASQGNASADIARTYMLFCLEKKEDIAKKYLKIFCEKSKTDFKYVQKWFPIVAASQLLKSKIEEKEFLNNWINVVDYE